jgi:succinoglycan biosynthesis transport protein ExoP
MNQETGGPIQILDLIDRLRKYWWTVIAGLCFGLTFAVVALNFIPKVYIGVTKVYLAPPKIPEEYMESNVVNDLEQRLWWLHEAVLAGPLMEDLIEQEFPEIQTTDDQTRLMRKIRNQLEVKVSQKVGYFELVYRDDDAVRAARMANTLADFYIRQNVENRAANAQETTNTMAERAETIGAEVDARRAEIEEFKSKHRFELGDYLESNWRKLEARHGEKDANRLALAAAKTRKDELIQQFNLRQQQLGIKPGGVAVDPYTAQVERLKAELEQLSINYSAMHPTVKQKQRELDELIATGPPRTFPGNQPGMANVVPVVVDPLEADIKRVTTEIEMLQDRGTSLASAIALLERHIDKTPEVDQRLALLTDGYSLLEKKYLESLRKADSARETLWMEETQQGRQLQIIERAEPASKPISPQPMQVYVVCLVAGLAIFVAPLLGKRLLNPTLSSETALLNMFKIPILTSIPTIETDETRRRIRRSRMVNYGLSLASAAIMIAAMIFL